MLLEAAAEQGRSSSMHSSEQLLARMRACLLFVLFLSKVLGVKKDGLGVALTTTRKGFRMAISF
jgi:hypothetical protein